jgi:hypothetical protein
MHATQNPVTNPVTPAQTLRAAAGYLLHYGWYQGDLFADLDQVESGELTTPAACALGAIDMAVRGTPVTGEWTVADVDEHDQALAVLADYLILHLGVSDPHVYEVLGTDPTSTLERAVADWNDAPERICSHVMAALYGAADEWDRLQAADAVVASYVARYATKSVAVSTVGGVA